MIHSRALLLLTVLLASFPAVGQRQQITPDPAMATVPQAPTTPETLKHPPKADTLRQPPQVNPDRSVTFYFVAPNAQKVALASDMTTAPLPMKKNADGVWTVTTAPVAPAIYTYHFDVDGENALDPANRWHKPSLLYQDNLFEVHGDQPQPWDRTAVPHGNVTHHYFDSAVIGVPTEYYVYTPPNYDPGAKAKYPVLYLLHGYSDGADAWVATGRANFILDNLIAQGRAKPMIMVMTRGYGAPEVLEDPVLLMKTEVGGRNISLFQESLFREVMPSIERSYRVMTGPSNTAIAGLSMGAFESLAIGISHPDKFGYVGSFSGGLSAAFGMDPADSKFQWKAPRKLLWIGCGDADPLVFDMYSSLKQSLQEQKVQATFVTTPGAAHTWPLWREYLAQFAPLLFR